MLAIEVKRSHRFVERDLTGLRMLASDYPVTRCLLFYGGDRRYRTSDGIDVIPLAEGLLTLPSILAAE
jgi:hypothetical protein